MSTALYDTDYFKWTKQQAGLLKEGQLASLDIEHLIEELESMGARERRELVNRLVVLLVHLLRWQFQPERRRHSWRRTIKARRMEIVDLLSDNPSLKSEAFHLSPIPVNEFSGRAKRYTKQKDRINR